MSDYIRLNITVEGQTEQAFCEDALAAYLEPFGVVIQARRALTSRRKNKRGGISSYERLKYDLHYWMREEKDSTVRFTTMFDLYALPKSFPGYEAALKISSPYEKVDVLERAFSEDMGDRRFIPYFQLHEFEALILSRPSILGEEYFDYAAEIEELSHLLAAYQGNSELINEGRETAPSKQIKGRIPGYEKVTVGAYLAELIGIPELKPRCRHFGQWITRLESLG